MTVEIEIEIDTEMDTEIEIVIEIDTDIDTETEIVMDILLLLTLQPHNLAHPQPFSDEQATSPFRWDGPMGVASPTAMEENGLCKTKFHRLIARISSRRGRSRG